MPDLDIGRVLVLPNRRLAGLILTEKFDIDIIAKAISISQKHKILVRNVVLSPISPEENRMVVFLDFTESDVSIEDLAKEIEGSGAGEVEGIIKAPVEGFIADTLSDRLMVSGSRVIILREQGYREILRGIRQRFGVGGEEFLYQVGFVSGTGFAKLHRKTAEAVGIKDPVEIIQKISSAMFQWAGFGRMEVKMLTPEHFMILVYNSFECEMGRGSVMPYSYFVRGIFAGSLGEIFGKAFAVTETACIARGDPCCHFEAIAKPITR